MFGLSRKKEDIIIVPECKCPHCGSSNEPFMADRDYFSFICKSCSRDYKIKK